MLPAFWALLFLEEGRWVLRLSSHTEIQIGVLLIDKLSTTLVSLSFLVAIWVNLSSLFSIRQKQLFFLLIRVLICILRYAFLCSTYLSFYLLFEASLFPISLLILGWGYQPERISASFSIILYTMIASLPLLLLFLWLTIEQSMFRFRALSFTSFYRRGELIRLAIIAAFLVKLPIFIVHLWLPKAHVEAPVGGSMVLAALLLKLGGFGLWRCLPLRSSILIMSLVKRFALIGGALISLLCLRQIDVKVLIAYSSVAHIRLVIASILSASLASALASLFMLLAHGASSSALFAGANHLYNLFHTRRIALIRGTLVYAPFFCLFWFLRCVAGIAAPPSFNLVAEIIRVTYFFSSGFSPLTGFALISFLAAAYSLILYAIPLQGQHLAQFIPFKRTSLKERLIIAAHASWFILLIFLIV